MKLLAKSLVVMLVLSVAFEVHTVFGLDETEIILNPDNICEISLQSLSPWEYESEAYDYIVKNAGEITYITHLLNSLDLSEGKVAITSDGSSLWIGMEYQDGSDFCFSIYPGGIVITQDLMYRMSFREYNGFLDFIHAIKTKKLILGETVTKEPSAWAKEDVEEAIENGLVPKRNQIGYQESITRLEVCQLIFNYLKKCEYVLPSESQSPFEDTIDESVDVLYQLGILHGKTETEFYPYDFITREEYAKILNNVYELVHGEVPLEEDEVPYIDQEQIASWAQAGVKKMTAKEFFCGNEEGAFEPQRNISKEEVIITVLRMNQ